MHAKLSKKLCSAAFIIVNRGTIDKTKNDIGCVCCGFCWVDPIKEDVAAQSIPLTSLALYMASVRLRPRVIEPAWCY